MQDGVLARFFAVPANFYVQCHRYGRCIRAPTTLTDPSRAVTDHPWLTTGLLALGTFTFAKFFFKAFGVILQTFVLPGTNVSAGCVSQCRTPVEGADAFCCTQLKKYGAGKGAWAIVTGASEGIGREFALQLAKKGFNVLIMSRSKDKLDALCCEIGTPLLNYCSDDIFTCLLPQSRSR